MALNPAASRSAFAEGSKFCHGQVLESRELGNLDATWWGQVARKYRYGRSCWPPTDS